MKNKFLYWSPRILSIFFVIFLSLFCFDSFDEFNGWESIMATLIHLIIPFIVLIGIIIAWKRDMVGSIIFCVLAICYVFMVGFKQHWSWYVSISGPALLIAILFFLNWWNGKNKK
jgi:cell division protein FtsW (lipid II flippase)